MRLQNKSNAIGNMVTAICWHDPAAASFLAEVNGYNFVQQNSTGW